MEGGGDDDDADDDDDEDDDDDDQLLGLSAVISCLDYLLRAAVEIIC